MNRLEVSKITCIVDVRLSARIEAEADRMGLKATFSERGKQIALLAPPIWQPFARRARMLESPSDLIRLYVPRSYEQAAMARLASAADLFLPGRGSIFAEDVVLVGRTAPLWDEATLCADPLPSWAAAIRLELAPYDLVFCIVQRGQGSDLARAMLEMGLGVPIVGYGEGMGLRDQLGLLRITIPQEKEILRFLVPSGDSDSVVDIAVRKARLQEPGRGFLGRIPVRALAVNARMNLDRRRRHVASMEQVISTLDQLRGSTDWRRRSSSSRRPPGDREPATEHLLRFTLVCEEGAAAAPVRAALDAGARGATLSRLSLRQPASGEGPDEVAITSHARESCDIIVPRRLAAPLENAVASSAFFTDPANGFIETGHVQDAITYLGG